MLASLKMEIMPQSKERYTYNIGSLLQGVLMQNIDTEYAEYLHLQGVNPYSQTFEKTDKGYLWTVNTLTLDAKNEILNPLLNESFNSFYIKHKQTDFTIVRKQYSETDYEELLKMFYLSENQENIVKFELITPTSFKSNGQYEFLPDMKLIYQSLMNRYHVFCKKFEMKDYDVLLELVQDTKIIDYKLHSTRFQLEGIKIPAYMGEIVVRIKGANTMISLAKLLFSFGEYSGVGIKTSIGMGGMRLL